MSSPTKATIKRLFAVAGNRCAFPGCDAPLVIDKTVTAEICHIKAQSEGGPRYDPDQTDSERHGFDNLVLMCGDHHKVIDDEANLETYTVEWLRGVKAQHEAQYAGGPEPGDEVVAQFLVQLQGDLVLGNKITIHVTYQGAQVAIPSPEAVVAHRAALREKLEADARKRWGGMAFYIQEEGATLPVEASPYQTGRLGARENLLQTLHAADRLLVLGEPGSGKTVSLERLAWGMCEGERADVPVLVPLRDYAEKSLAEWALSFLRETGHLRLDDVGALEAFLDQGTCRCTFLFDGLNEVAPPYRNRLIEDLRLWITAHPRHAMILTSRSQDELWRRLRGEVDGTVVVQPVGDAQMEAYLVAHLDEQGRELCGRLDDRLREMARTPLILWLVKEAGAAGESLPGNRGELYERFVGRMLRRDTQQRQLDAEIPDRVKMKALTGLAYGLSLEQRLSCTQEEAVEIVAQALGDGQAEQVVMACARHGLLAGEEAVWFAPHQTVQEHFAALALREMVEQEQCLGWGERLRRGVRRVLAGKDEGLTALAAVDWWMETFVQLAGLTDDADWLAREVARANPWLAWWCVEEGREVAEETREFVEGQSIRLLESERVADRRRAVRALTRMRSGRTIDPLFQAAADEDVEVAGLASQALIEMGDAARGSVARALQGKDRRQWAVALGYLFVRSDVSAWAVQPVFQIAADEDVEVAEQAVQVLVNMTEAARGLVEEALRGSDRRLWRAALRYLGARPEDPLFAEIPGRVWKEVVGQPMVWVGPGPFLMGSDKKRDSQAYDNELPQHEVMLSGYWIGQCQVTNAEYRAFIEGDGYQTRAYWTQTGWEWRRGRAHPDYWDDKKYNSPQQPVVGVSWYEAVAYCRWLGEQTGLPVRLPSEAEWEKAARGTDGRIYPWGDKFDKGKCNVRESGVGTTTPVGKYSPQGDSPYGCADMAGNVLEWTGSLRKPYPYRADDGREDPNAAGSRVLRGGSFNYNEWFARCAFRYDLVPVTRFRLDGFRVGVGASPISHRSGS